MKKLDIVIVVAFFCIGSSMFLLNLEFEESFVNHEQNLAWMRCFHFNDKEWALLFSNKSIVGLNVDADLINSFNISMTKLGIYL